MNWRMRAGNVIGRSHLVAGKNNQDAVKILEFKTSKGIYRIGIICDGCSEGKNSEVGAKLTAHFAVNRIFELVNDSFFLTKDIPKALYFSIQIFLMQLLEQYSSANEERFLFINDHFLFTIIGFIQGPNNTVVFSIGDGVIIINGDIQVIDQNDTPNYLAYHLVDGSYLGKGLYMATPHLDVQAVKTNSLEKLAIGSDAWNEEPYLLFEEIWNNKHPYALQRKMNAWSNIHKKFKDDASLIILEKE